MIGLLTAVASIAALAWASSPASARVGVEVGRRARREVDCCDAETDDWRSAGAVYRDWRSGTPLPFNAGYAECFAESLEAATRGDYGKPADRRCSLGKMHAHKRSAWLACRRGCAGGADASGVRVLEDTAGTVYSVDGSADNYLIRVDERGDWIVELFSPGRRSRVIDRHEDFASADAAVRELLDSPF